MAWARTRNLSIDASGQLWRCYRSERCYRRCNMLLGELAAATVEAWLEPELAELREAWAAAYDRVAEERWLLAEFWATR